MMKIGRANEGGVLCSRLRHVGGGKLARNSRRLIHVMLVNWEEERSDGPHCFRLVFVPPQDREKMSCSGSTSKSTVVGKSTSIKISCVGRDWPFVQGASVRHVGGVVLTTCLAPTGGR